MDRILDQWQWDSILPCHGTFIPSGMNVWDVLVSNLHALTNSLEARCANVSLLTSFLF